MEFLCLPRSKPEFPNSLPLAYVMLRVSVGWPLVSQHSTAGASVRACVPCREKPYLRTKCRVFYVEYEPFNICAFAYYSWSEFCRDADETAEW